MKRISYFLFLFLLFTKILCLKGNKINDKIHINSSYASYFINSTIKSLNHKNFDTIIKHNSSINYIVLLTFRRCPKCNKIITTTENVEKYYSSKNNTNLKFAKLDCYANGWTCLRFDIFKIPLFIYISGDYYSYFIPNNFTEEELISFIENENKEYKNYPEKIGFFGVFMKVFHVVSENIQKKIYYWNEACSWAVVLIVFLGFLYFEYSLYRACCDSHKYNNEPNKKDNNKTKVKKE